MDVSRARAPQLVALSLLVAVAGCGPAGDDAVAEPTTGAQASPSSPEVDGGDVEGSLQERVQEHTTAFVGDGPGGAIVYVTRDDEVVTAAAGTATADGEPLTVDTPMRVGSITKPFVATVVLQLAEEGRVDLDAPLARYLPGAAVGGDRTPRQLLSHRSGLPNYTDHPSFIPAVLAEREVALELEDVLAYASSEAMPAGESFQYSNTNYLVLGQLIERLDGRTLAESLAARITDPLGLEATRLDDGRGEVVGVAGGWSPGILGGDPSAPYASIATSAWAAGALVTTAPDLATYLEELLVGRLLSEEMLGEMTSTGAEGYGLGLMAVGFGGDARGYGHGGATPGYSATMGIDPSTGDLIVVLTNSDSLVADQLAQGIVQRW